MDYYNELEISSSASTEVIRASYKALVKKYHPDVYRGNPTFASVKLKNLNLAYSVLSDPQKRNEYDYLNSINNKNKSSENSGEENKNTYSDDTATKDPSNNSYQTQNQKTNTPEFEEESEYYSDEEYNRIILPKIIIGIIIIVMVSWSIFNIWQIISL